MANFCGWWSSLSPWHELLFLLWTNAKVVYSYCSFYVFFSCHVGLSIIVPWNKKAWKNCFSPDAVMVGVHKWCNLWEITISFEYLQSLSTAPALALRLQGNMWNICESSPLLILDLQCSVIPFTPVYITHTAVQWHAIHLILQSVILDCQLWWKIF